MIRYSKKIYFLKVYECWFTYKFNFWEIFKFYAYLHVKNLGNKKIIGIQKNSHTIELDITQTEEAILFNFSKQIRQQSKIAEKEAVVCYFHQDIDKFVEFFNDFATRKNTFATTKNLILQKGESIILSFASCNGQILAAHSYLVDYEEGIVRHFHSATKNPDEIYDRNFIGRANKYLTVKNIFYFKEKGFKIFDFGGYEANSTDPGLLGINQYKLLFGGNVVTCLNYYSFSYWLLKKLAKLFGQFGKV